jgi:hypothetical protein
MYRLFAIAVVTTAVVVACDTVPLTSPTGSTISISIDKSVLPIDGQATVTAVVTEVSGTAVHNGTVVTFQPSIGMVNPPEAKTVNGVATTTFLAGTASGTGVIHAFSGGARTGSGNSSSGGVEIRIGAAAAGALSVSSTPPSISQSGGTVTISALVVDSSNNPLPGVSVLFTASSGALGSTQALSDANGIARTTLNTTQTTTVTAIAGAAKGEVQVVVSTAPTITLTVPDTGNVGVPVPISVTATGGGNNTPRQIQTLVVDYGDGTSDTRSNVTGSAGFTHTYQQARGYTVTATATDVSGNTGIASDTIVISRTLPTVTLTAPTTPIDFSDTSGVAGFTVAASSAAGQPPIQSVVVRLGDGTVIFSGTGGAAFTYQFPAVGTYAVNATVTDSAGGVGTASAVVRVVP